jgi:hypothetical protein
VIRDFVYWAIGIIIIFLLLWNSRTCLGDL